jgi:hypothetical protein
VLTEEQLTESMREALVGAGAVREVKMFGGIRFILNGNLTVAASKRGLLARVGRERQDDALARAAARPGQPPSDPSAPAPLGENDRPCLPQCRGFFGAHPREVYSRARSDHVDPRHEPLVDLIDDGHGITPGN